MTPADETAYLALVRAFPLVSLRDDARARRAGRREASDPLEGVYIYGPLDEEVTR